MRRAHPCSLSWWGGGFFAFVGGQTAEEQREHKKSLSFLALYPHPPFFPSPFLTGGGRRRLFYRRPPPFLPLFGVEESILSLSEAGQGNDEPKRERERETVERSVDQRQTDRRKG